MGAGSLQHDSRRGGIRRVKDRVLVADLSRDDLERLVLRLQSLAQSQRELLDDLAGHSDYVRRRIDELDASMPRIQSGLLRRLISRPCETDLARIRARSNDARVWSRVGAGDE